jgi:hypothetical protein
MSVHTGRTRPVTLRACIPLCGQQTRNGDKEGAQSYVRSGRRACFSILEGYYRGDDGTQTWSAREQDKLITVPIHVTDPLGH